MIIELHEHVFAGGPPRTFEVDSLAAWLLSHYGDTPHVTVQVFDGDPSAEAEITGDLGALLGASGDRYVVLESPGAFGYTAFQVFQFIVVVLSVASVLLAPKPNLPSNVNRTQSSPNNALANRENQVRLQQRVEDIYGKVLAIPSLMMPTYSKYRGNTKFEYGYYCVGRGYYEIEDVKDGETLIAGIRGARASFYDPFKSPNSGDIPFLRIGDPIDDDVLTVSRSVEIDGVTLKALNQVQLPNTPTGYIFDTTGRITQGGTVAEVVFGNPRKPNFNAVVSVGDELVVTGTGPASPTVTTGPATFVFATKTITTPAGSGLFGALVVGSQTVVTGTTLNNKALTVVTKPDDNTITVSQVIDNETAPAATFTLQYNYDGTYVADTISDGYLTVESNTWASAGGQKAVIQIVGVSDWTDWVTLPNVDRTQVWANVVAQNGMYRDDGGRSEALVEFIIEYEQLSPSLTPLGVVETVTSSLSGSVTDERAITVEHTTAWTGPARVRMRRMTPYDYDFKGTIVDEIKWIDLYSVSPIERLEFGNKTTVHTVTEATARATAVKTRQINCAATRRLPLYDGSTFTGAFDADGRLASGTISGTNRVADIIAAISVDPKIGRRNLATDVDMPQIYGVQQALDAWNDECGQFNYTLDSDNISYEETINLVANAAFCIAYRQNSKIRLSFDRAQANSTAMFSHRNKAPNSETITRKFASDAGYDGVEFIYSDPDSLQSETIRLPLDGSAMNPRKFEIAGIRSYEQAWLRANREYYKILGQRVTIETQTTNDARALLPNTRVDIVDNTRFKSYDGDVVGQSGLEITLSRAVEFTPGQPHSVVLARRDGSLQSIAVTPGQDARRVVLASLPAEALVVDRRSDGERTRFSFASDDARAAQAYLVQEVEITDGEYPTVRAVNYSDAYYQADYATIPDKETVIN